LAAGLYLRDTLIRLFAYFTILTNIFVAVVATICGLFPNSRWGRVFASPKVFGCVVTSLVLVGIVFHIMLRDVYDPDGIKALANYLNHYFTPAAMLVYWLAFPTKQPMSLSVPVYWVIYPILYTFYITIRGELIGNYPYFFFDVNELGYPQAIINALVLFLIVFTIGYIVRWGVKHRSRRQDLIAEGLAITAGELWYLKRAECALNGVFPA